MEGIKFNDLKAIIMMVSTNYALLGIDDMDEYNVSIYLEPNDCFNRRAVEVNHTTKIIHISMNNETASNV